MKSSLTVHWSDLQTMVSRLKPRVLNSPVTYAGYNGNNNSFMSSVASTELKQIYTKLELVTYQITVLLTHMVKTGCLGYM